MEERDFNLVFVPPDLEELALLAPTPLNPSMPYVASKAANLIGAEASTVDPMAGVAPNGTIIPVQGIEADLMALRAQMPYLPIIRRPNRIANVVMAAVPAPVNVTVADGTDMLVQFGSNSEFYVSFGGNANVPVLTGVEVGSDVMCNPSDEWFYCGGIGQISVYSPFPGAIISCRFIAKR